MRHAEEIVAIYSKTNKTKIHANGFAGARALALIRVIMHIMTIIINLCAKRHLSFAKR